MNKHEIITYFQNKALLENTLFQVELDITSNCNCECLFCFQGNHHSSNNDLSLEQIIKLLDELREIGVLHIAISGGEPFIRSDAIRIIEEINKRGFLITIITNGMFLNEELLGRLSDIKIDRLTFSFHSIHVENYTRIFGINNETLFYKSLDNIKTSIKLGIPTGIAVTVNKYNIDELKDIKEFFLNLGLTSKDINFNMLLKGKKEIESINPTEKQISTNSVILLEKDCLLYQNKQRCLLCTAGRSSCAIDAKGNIYPCTFFNSKIGNIKDDSIKEVWENSHVLKIIRSFSEIYFEKCMKCEYRNSCKVCMSTNLNETGNPFVPSEEYCKLRKARINLYDKS